MEVPKSESKPQRKDQQRDDYHRGYQRRTIVHQRHGVPSHLSVVRSTSYGKNEKNNDRASNQGKRHDDNSNDANEGTSEDYDD